MSAVIRIRFYGYNQYDEGLLTEPQTQQGGILPTYAEACSALAELKSQLMAKGEASDLFGRERDNGLSAILGNLDQSVFGEPAYPSIEAKAAHLLYFVVKNHPFLMVINVVAHFYLLISYIEMGVCWIIMDTQLSMILGLQHSLY